MSSRITRATTKASTAPREPLQLLPQKPNLKRACEDNGDTQDALPASKRASKGQAPSPSMIISEASTASSSAPAIKKKQISVIEQQPDWAFDVTGTWEIDASKLDHDLHYFRRSNPEDPPPFILELRYANNPKQKKIGRQLWGTFKWGSLVGCMKLCPGHSFNLTHLQFDDECILEKGMWVGPGPAPRGTATWNFRWKAKNEVDKSFVEGSDEYETQLRFSRAVNGTLKLDGKMVVMGYKARKFSGVKTHEAAPQNGSHKSVDDWWGKVLKDPYEESRREHSRRNKGGMDESDESETDQELEREFIKRLDENRAKQKAADKKRKLQEARPWPTPMTGTWKITLTNGSSTEEKGGTAPWVMNIHEDVKGSTRQFWADFQFGHNWNGILRLCPEQKVKGESFEVKDFEEACILKDSIEVGPPPKGINTWMLKWRGSYIDRSLPAYKRKQGVVDDVTTGLTVMCGDDGKLVMSGMILESCIFRRFEGVRTGDAKRGLAEPSVETLWYNARFKEPGPPKKYEWKSPILVGCIEKPPAWAWDVLGKWKIEGSEIAASLAGNKKAPFTMMVYMSNSKQPASLGRHLWAKFSIGSKIHGCCRFIPLPENSRPQDDVKDFEKVCKLGKNVWPGDEASAKGLSFQKWGMRWRAANAKGENIPRGDDFETALHFWRDDHENLVMEGVWTVDYQPRTWNAVKVEDGGVSDGTEALVKAVWNDYAWENVY